MKILFVNKKSLFFDYFEKKGLGVAIYKELNSSFLKGLRRIHHILNLPLFSLWYTQDFKGLNHSDENEIIVFDSNLSIEPTNYIRKKNNCLRIVYWHWNHINSPDSYNKLATNIERWSYDFYDCKLYNLNYNSQFYIGDYAIQHKTTIERDCFFIGAVKTRGGYIDNCKDILSKAGLTSLFILSDNTRKDREKKWVDYGDILTYIASSRCIIDIVPDSQCGMTLRPLEALFFNKKLITNYKSIKDFDFYSRDNVFIMGLDDESRLYDFIMSPFNHEVLKYASYYDVRSWLNRFML